MHHTPLAQSDTNSTCEHTLNSYLQKQQEAFLDNPYPSLEERLATLKTLAKALKKFSGLLCEAEQKDFCRKSAKEVMLTELAPLMEHIRYVRAKLARWMRADKRALPFYLKPGRVCVQQEPLGCVGIVSPWNYPVALTFSPLIDALAAGNHVMIKLSEHTPHTAQVICELLANTFSPEKVCAFIGGIQTAKDFVALPFDHLLYTGSTEIGKDIMRQCAQTLTPVTLELGGKSPCILGQTNHFERSVKKIAFGKCINAGQTCIAPDVLFCPKDKVQQLATLYFQSIAAMYPGNLCHSDYTSIINAGNFNRLSTLLNDAQAQGLEVHRYCESTAKMVENRCFAPALVIDPPPSHRLWQEEIFGPILVVKTYNDTKEVLQQLKHWAAPLTIYLFSDHEREVELIQHHTQSGSLCINEVLIQYAIDDAPFGGVGPSGFGRYHAYEGFKTFSNPRTIVQQPNTKLSQIVHPPFGGAVQRLAMRFFTR